MEIRHFNKCINPVDESKRIYKERDMILVHYATRINAYERFLNKEIFRNKKTSPVCGWFIDETAPPLMQKVISLDNGKRGFHVSTDLDTGDLPEIKPNVQDWSVENKFNQMAKDCGMEELKWT